MPADGIYRRMNRRDRDGATLSGAHVSGTRGAPDLSWRQFFAALRVIGACYDGGYPAAYLTDDGETFCPDCARKNASIIARAIRDRDRGGWRVVAVFPSWENETDPETGEEIPGYCANCGEELAVAYTDRPTTTPED